MTASDRAMWGRMRMDPTDIADVTAATYTYLVNGHGPRENWTGLFRPGKRVRLRFINAATMTIFNIRIPGLPMTVVSADGLNVRPVTVDEFQIGNAETYDVIIQPAEDKRSRSLRELDRPFRHGARHVRAALGHGSTRSTASPAPHAHHEGYGHGRHGPWFNGGNGPWRHGRRGQRGSSRSRQFPFDGRHEHARQIEGARQRQGRRRRGRHRHVSGRPHR